MAIFRGGNIEITRGRIPSDQIEAGHIQTRQISAGSIVTLSDGSRITVEGGSTTSFVEDYSGIALNWPQREALIEVMGEKRLDSPFKSVKMREPKTNGEAARLLRKTKN